MRKKHTLSHTDKVIAGLERLAFGDCNDAVKLVFFADTLTPETISTLDLFSVTEMKRDKNGGVEVKLCDRQKAMERLLLCADHAESQKQAEQFLHAFTESGNANDAV